MDYPFEQADFIGRSLALRVSTWFGAVRLLVDGSEVRPSWGKFTVLDNQGRSDDRVGPQAVADGPCSVPPRPGRWIHGAVSFTRFVLLVSAVSFLSLSACATHMNRIVTNERLAVELPPECTQSLLSSLPGMKRIDGTERPGDWRERLGMSDGVYWSSYDFTLPQDNSESTSRTRFSVDEFFRPSSHETILYTSVRWEEPLGTSEATAASLGPAVVEIHRRLVEGCGQTKSSPSCEWTYEDRMTSVKRRCTEGTVYLAP